MRLEASYGDPSSIFPQRKKPTNTMPQSRILRGITFRHIVFGRMWTRWLGIHNIGICMISVLYICCLDEVTVVNVKSFIITLELVIWDYWNKKCFPIGLSLHCFCVSCFTGCNAWFYHTWVIACGFITLLFYFSIICLFDSRFGFENRAVDAKGKQEIWKGVTIKSPSNTRERRIELEGYECYNSTEEALVWTQKSSSCGGNGKWSEQV